VNFDSELTLFDLFEKACNQYQNLPAINYYGIVFSYKQLMEKTALTVEHLKALPLEKTHPVAIYMDHSPEMIIAKLALAALAIPYIPLDPVYPIKRNKYIIQNANTNYVLTNSNQSINFLEENTQTVFIDQVIKKDKKAKKIISTATKKDLLYLIYTSGSTGKPKGVMVPNKGVANYLLWMKDLFDVSTESKILAKTSISFDISVWELFLPLISGGTLILKKRIDMESPEQIASIISEHQVTIMQFVPSGLRLFNDANMFTPLTSLENIFCGGEKMPVNLKNEVSKKFKGTLHNLYGPTEASIFMSHYKCLEDSKHYTVPIGRPIFNSSMYILDDNKKLVPRGIPGHIYIGGEILADGYWKNKEQTEQVFVTYLNDISSEIIYKTGDMGRMLLDGNFEFHGRNDNQIKIRGYRVELGEIEAAISKDPEIREVVAYKNILDVDDERLNALIVADSLINIEALKKTLNSVLPKYMIPSLIHQVDEAPKLPNGKIDFKVLQENKQNNTKSNTQIKKQVESEIEASIFKIWTEVIGHDNFSLTDNFFDAGGHSVLFLKIKERLENMLAMDFSIIELYQYPNIKSIADEYRKRYANVISDKAKTIRSRTQLKKQSFGKSRRK
jgi:amino acid adenylation domain-containing protein